ncbi:carbohydrate sulfotransferase 8-like isoform X1 [Macrobrachium rosenbergii]|uniref:carbohydrate sulfotransferase 8-like isoform X1 n=1 Tax=Macrobrachium rosenbergii TaxID=79674 RepID=UPI0034D608C2
MRLRLRLRSLFLLALLSTCVVIYSFVGVHFGSHLELSGESHKARRVVARITADDLIALGRYSDPVAAPIVIQNNGRNAFGIQTIVNSSDIRNLDISAPAGIETSAKSTSTAGETSLLSQAPLVAPGSLSASPLKEASRALPPAAVAAPPAEGNEKPCDGGCHFRRLREQSLAVLSQVRARKIEKTLEKDGKITRTLICDQACRLAQLKNRGAHRGGYSSRVQVENVTLPDSWTVTRELVDRLTARRNHVQKVCKKYGLNKPTKTYQPNAWEFLINAKFGLVWCNVFKAASSTWFYNFNLLAGFTEQELLHAKETPIQLARKRYARPTVEELQQVLNSTRQPLSFLIARHPLQRLVSGYRDKILSGNRYYSKLARTILRQYRDLGKGEERDKPQAWAVFGRSTPRSIVPSFPQFVQYLLDESARGHRLDEHWTPVSEFCTPCLVDFDVFAKVETMEEDGNYIIFSAGIQDVIKPKRINRSRNEPTDAVADKFLCQLSPRQMDGLLKLYKYDIELFEYDVSKYVNCTRS